MRIKELIITDSKEKIEAAYFAVFDFRFTLIKNDELSFVETLQTIINMFCEENHTWIKILITPHQATYLKDINFPDWSFFNLMINLEEWRFNTTFKYGVVQSYKAFIRSNIGVNRDKKRIEDISEICKIENFNNKEKVIEFLDKYQEDWERQNRNLNFKKKG